MQPFVQRDFLDDPHLWLQNLHHYGQSLPSPFKTQILPMPIPGQLPNKPSILPRPGYQTLPDAQSELSISIASSTNQPQGKEVPYPYIMNIENGIFEGEYSYKTLLSQDKLGCIVSYKATSNFQTPEIIIAKFGEAIVRKEKFYIQKMFKRNPNLKHITSGYQEWSDGEKSCIFFEKQGESIRKYLKREPFQGKLTLIEIAKQMVDAVKEMHELGYLHQNIRPENFRIQQGTVILFDFSRVNEYMPNGVHKQKSRFGNEGKPQYASFDAQMGYNLSRKDDLECLGYTLMNLLNEEKVPWKHFDHELDILLSKRDFLKNELSEDSKIFDGIKNFIVKANSLKFEEAPDYEEFKNIINDLEIYQRKVYALSKTLYFPIQSNCLFSEQNLAIGIKNQ